MEQNNSLYVPPTPGFRFSYEFTQILFESEILQSFAWLTNITDMVFHFYDQTEEYLEDVKYQIRVSSEKCFYTYYHYQCLPPLKYYPKYIWTKEGFEI